MGKITATDYIERESCGTLLAILHLEFYVWSFCAFLLDSSTYTPTLFGVFAFHRRSHPLSVGMPQSGSKILYHHVDYGRDYCH
jgi:hypothetical protein